MTVSRKLLGVMLIGCVGVLAYLNTFQAAFHFDDGYSIITNTRIKDLSSLAGMWYFWPTRFVTYLTFAVNYRFGQLDVQGYHLINVLIHIGSALLVWRLLQLICASPAMEKEAFSQHAGTLSLLVALVFLSHPLQTESVTYIHERATELAGFFYLAALCCYALACLRRIKGCATVPWYPFSWCIAAVCMITKENAVTLPFAVLLFEICFFKEKRPFAWRYVLPFFILLPVIPMLMAYAKPVTFDDVHKLMQYQSALRAMGYYFLTQLRVMVTYMRLLVLPVHQNFDYDYAITKTLLDFPTLASLLVVVSWLAAAKRLFARHRLVSFGILWFFLSLSPDSSIFPLADVIFEHRLYLGIFGYGIVMVSVLYRLLARRNWKWTVAVVAVLICWYSVLTWRRNVVWKDEISLWTDVVDKSPQKERGYIIRGNAYYNKGKTREALSDFNKAIAVAPRSILAYMGRGNLYAGSGQLEQAISDYSQAITINPSCSEAYNSRGVLFRRQGRLDEAIADYDQALRINTGYARAYNNRGNAYQAKGSLAPALSDYNKAVLLDPSLSEAYYNRAGVYRTRGSLDMAIADYNRAIAVRPGYVEAYIYRGLVYGMKADFDQAIADYNKAIQMDPKAMWAYAYRAVAYFFIKDYEKSWLDVRRVEELDRRLDPEFIQRLQQASGRQH
ncbi:MAG TPA: tetratricopeptide repeat protein [Patescibacteria group bacterium]|nr:tetratricopeptide repeat protein [Patescibacteria group bacterium]